MQRIGQILSHVVPLSAHDVEEIVQEQRVTRLRFGDAALALGLVRPEHIWRAWLAQIQHTPTEVDLDQIGIDTQAIHYLAAATARQFGVVPVRAFDNLLVIAANTTPQPEVIDQIQRTAAKHVIIVYASKLQIDQQLQHHYAGNQTSNYASTDGLMTFGASQAA
jgi:hypothetical protein